MAMAGNAQQNELIWLCKYIQYLVRPLGANTTLMVMAGDAQQNELILLCKYIQYLVHMHINQLKQVLNNDKWCKDDTCAIG